MAQAFLASIWPRSHNLYAKDLCQPVNHSGLVAGDSTESSSTPLTLFYTRFTFHPILHSCSSLDHARLPSKIKQTAGVDHRPSLQQQARETVGITTKIPYTNALLPQ